MVLNIQLVGKEPLNQVISKLQLTDVAVIFPECSFMTREQVSEGEVLCPAWHLARDGS